MLVRTLANVDRFSKFFNHLENSLCTHTDFHLTCDMLLHYIVKVENAKIENAKMLLILTASSTNC